MIVKLTSDFIENNLRCPEGKRRIEYCDKDLPGLYILVAAGSNIKSFFLRYKDANGKTCHQKIGRTTDIDLDEARARVKTLKAEQLLGIDRWADEKARKAVPTFSVFMETMYENFAYKNKKTAPKDMEYYRLRLKAAFGHKRLNQISRREIQLFHSALRDEELAPATCNHYLKLMKRVLNLAIQWEIIDGPCAAKGIQMYRELNLVENYMDDEQLQRLLTVLKTDKNRMVCNIIMYLLSTGARLNEALQARWDHINLERRVWRIPATNSKSGKVRAVPLNDSAIDVLNEVGTKDKSEWVFPSKRNHGQPFVSLQRVWSRLRKSANLEHIRIHDLRHQYASFLVNSGVSLYCTGEILGHSTPKVTKRYAHLSTATLQDAAATASNALKKSA